MSAASPNFIIVVGAGLKPESFGAAAPKVIIADGGSQLWGKGLEQFRATSVLLLYDRADEPMPALIAARQLVKVTAELRLAKIDKPDGLDFDRVYQNTQKIPDFIIDLSDGDFLALVDHKGDIIVHPSQDFVDGKLYYGVRINRERYLLSSEHELLSQASAASRGILLRHNEECETRMSHEAITASFFESKQMDTGQLFRSIRKYVQELIYLPLQEMYDVVTVWVMGTYVHSIFRYYPYLHLHAEKASGKTLLMEILAPICFNGIVTASPNSNSVLRLINQSRSTIFIDEAESFAGSLDGGSELMAILKTGFNCTGDVVRSKQHFSTYGPKGFASINALNDVLADRTIEIRLVRKTQNERIFTYRETPELLVRQQRMRDQLYLYGLCYSEEIAASYSRDDGPYDKLIHLTNRAFDVWVPLFKIAATLGDDRQKHQIFDSLDHYSQLDGRRRRRRDTEENESANLIIALQEMMLELKPVRVEGTMEYYDPDSVHFFLQRSGFLEKSVQKKSLSRLLSRTLDIESVPKAFGELTKRMYAVDHAKLEEYKKRYTGAVP